MKIKSDIYWLEKMIIDKYKKRVRLNYKLKINYLKFKVY